jgi:hypothetical protein
VNAVTPLKPPRDEIAIREQLESIVASSPFTASKKYPALLRYIVEETLAGRADHLKERNLGVAVFGRSPDYDTNQDPVVRTAAAEVRRRLALYYHNHGEDQTVEIHIPSGSYIPVFTSKAAVVIEQPQLHPERAPEPVQRARISRKLVYTGCTVLALVLIGAVWIYGKPETARERFWKPFLDPKASPVVCFAAFTRNSQAPQSGSSPSTVVAQMPSSTGSPLFSRAAVSDIRALLDIAGLLRENHRRFELRIVSLTSLRDLQHKPAVVIGAFNNSWTRQLTQGLRFSFRRDDSVDTSWIFDEKNPSSREWQIVDTTSTTAAPEDYALIGRFRHPVTEETVIVAAGLTEFGTVAAGEFVSRDDRLEELDRAAEKGWDKKNLEVVIATKLVRSDAGPVRIVATHVW